jgi:hypothetical protein
MLDRGVKTSQAIKRLIAEYLGVPIGPQLKLLQRAHANLNQPTPSHTWGGRTDWSMALSYRHNRLAHRRRQFLLGGGNPNLHPSKNENGNIHDTIHGNNAHDIDNNSSVSSAEDMHNNDQFLALRHEQKQQHDLALRHEQHKQQRLLLLLLLQEELENDLEMEFLL